MVLRLPNSGLVELEFGNVGFGGEGKTGVPREKPLGTNERTNNKLNPHIASTPGFESKSNWWEASALTTSPLLILIMYDKVLFKSYQLLQ